MHDSFVVKTPGLLVSAVDGNVVHVHPYTKPTFVAAVQALHALAGKKPWDNCLCILGCKKAVVGSILVASIMPQIEGDNISWYTHKVHISTAVEPAAKRHCSRESSSEKK